MSLLTRISNIRTKSECNQVLRVQKFTNKYESIQPVRALDLLPARSFHSSAFLKDKKVDTKKVVTTTGTTTTQKTSAVVPDPRTVVRGPESLDDIKTNIVKLLDGEIQTVKDQTMAVDIQSDFTKQFLAKSRYEISESKDGEVAMIRTHGPHKIKVTFNRSEEPEENYDDQEAEPEEGAAEDEDASDLVERGDQRPASKQALTSEIAFGDKEGKWILSGFAGKDNRLYIEDMSISHAKTKEEEDEESLEALPFETLSDDLQDRIYDLLDEVNVDDQLAHFVKQYSLEAETKSAIKFFENLKGLLK